MSSWLEAPPPDIRIGPLGWIRVVLRGAMLVVVLLLGLLCLSLLRLIEVPFCGRARPLSPRITQAVCRASLVILGFRYRSRGRAMREKGALVANHTSWLDILVLNAGARIFFVSKAEVSAWPVIGWLARATGTVFIARKGTEAKRQQAVFEDRLRAGHQLLFFPEGTSTDGIRVLPFKSTLFQAFFTHGLDRVMHIQPVTVIYRAPEGMDPRFHGWWGDMGFGEHALRILAAPRQGSVEVIRHPPVPVDAFEGRKPLADHCERVIRTAHVLAVNETPRDGSST